MLKAFSFDDPDRLPTYYHESTAGLYVHGRKLLDLFNEYPPDNHIVFDHIPQPPEDAFDADGSYHEFKTDESGTEWEYRIFGIAGHPVKYPLDDWSKFGDFKMPPMPKIDKNEVAELKKNYLTWAPIGVSLFERLHALRPFENVLMDLYTLESNIVKLVDMHVEWYKEALQICIDGGCDIFMFGDDWGTQDSLLIGPDFFRSFFKPRLAELIKPIHDAGKFVMYHSCGRVEPLFNDLVEAGINGLWHQVGLYDAEKFAKKAADARVVLFLHMDRQQLIPLGRPAQITDAVKYYAQLHKGLGGGAVFYVEIENDAPFENVEALIKSVDEYR